MIVRALIFSREIIFWYFTQTPGSMCTAQQSWPVMPYIHFNPCYGTLTATWSTQPHQENYQHAICNCRGLSFSRRSLSLLRCYFYFSLHQPPHRHAILRPNVNRCVAMYGLRGHRLKREEECFWTKSRKSRGTIRLLGYDDGRLSRGA